jgi:predicted RecA/RadA family phage recombinase
MAEADFRHGTPLMVDHTPSAAVAAGKVIVAGGEVWIAHNDIEADRLGAVAAPSSSAVYEVTAGDAIAAGGAAGWDDTNKKVISTAGDAKFGIAITASAADLDKIMVRHDPT